MITGEMHFAMISQHDFLNNPGRENDLYEITSSSLNLPGAAWVTKYKGKERPPEPGPNRINSLYLWENYGFIEFTENKVQLSLKDIKGKLVNSIEIN